jgi:hypothetical protein
MRQDNATFFASAKSLEEFWILDASTLLSTGFRFWIWELPLKLCLVTRDR